MLGTVLPAGTLHEMAAARASTAALEMAVDGSFFRIYELAP